MHRREFKVALPVLPVAGRYAVSRRKRTLIHSYFNSSMHEDGTKTADEGETGEEKKKLFLCSSPPRTTTLMAAEAMPGRIGHRQHRHMARGSVARSSAWHPRQRANSLKCRPLAAHAQGRGERRDRTPDADSALRIRFQPSNIETVATPGLMLAQVAEDAGVPISVGCGEGQCGACEVEIRKGGGLEDGFVVRSCVTPVPRAELVAEGGELWEVSTDFCDLGGVW